MKVQINLDENQKETLVTITTDKITDEILELQKQLQSADRNKSYIKGYLEDEVYLIPTEDIETIYSENKKVFVRSNDKVYELKQRLYEIEEILPSKYFVRISSSEIVNFKKVKNMNFKLTGTILINFNSGNYSYASRRYIKKIKEYLDI